MPARAPASIDMLQTVMAALHREGADAGPVYSITWPVAPSMPISPMMARIRSLGVTPRPSVPSTRISITGDGVWGNALQRQDVLDLRRADAEGQRAEGAVRRRVAVAADDHHAGLGVALLGADDVDDPLAGVVEPVELDAELGGVPLHRVDLGPRHVVGDGERAVGGGNVVVHRRHGEIGAPHPPARLAEGVELVGVQLVDEVQVDVEEVGLARLGMRHVRIPDLSIHGSWAVHGARAGRGGGAQE